MGTFKIRYFLLLIPLFLFADNAPFRHALYLMHTGEVEKAIEGYEAAAKKNQAQDFETLRQLAFILMKEGTKSNDKETQLLSMYGAGLAASTSSIDILEEGLTNPDPEIQLVSLYFISQLFDNKSDHLIANVAMSSDFLSTRMEACYHLATRRHPHFVGHTESLMQRLPPPFRAFFPPLFALMGTADAMAVLRHLLDDPIPLVRVQAILSIVQFGRDDLLPIIRKRILHATIAEQEACALAVGYLKDTSSIPHLKKLADSSTDHVRLAALKALYALGDQSVRQRLEIMALSHNVFAIQALGEIPGSEDTLAELLYVRNIQVRINAALALLKLRDPRVTPALHEVFLPDMRGMAFQPHASVGSTHHAIKVIFSSDQKAKDPLIDLSVSLSLRELFLKEAMHLGEKSFLHIAKMIFKNREHALIPLLIRLLENLQTKDAIALLKEQAEVIGNPFIRDYANLALFRLKEEGPYEERVFAWLAKASKEDLIRLRPHLPLEERKEISEYSLSAEDKSQLLLDTFGALASRQDEKSIAASLTAIRKGNPKNRYALAGLLIRSTE